MRSAFAIAGSLLAIAALAQEAVVLKRAPKPKEEAAYQTVVELEILGTKVTLTSTLTEKVVSVLDNGNYVVETKYSNTRRTAGDAETEFAVEPDAMTFAPTGEIVSIKPKASPALYRGANLLGIFLPDGPVGKGDVWKKLVKGDSKLGTVDLSAEFKVVGREKVGSFDCLVVSGTARELIEKAPASVEQVLWINVADGTLVKRTATIKNLPTEGKANQAVNVKLTVTRMEEKPAGTGNESQ